MKQRIYHTDPNGKNYTTYTNKPLYVNSVGSAVLEDDFISGYKKSRNYYRLFYLHYGNINIKTDKEEFTVKSGQLIIFPPDTPFTYSKTHKGRIEYLWLNFTGSEAEELIKSVFLYDGAPIDVGIPLYIFEAFETMFGEYAERTPFFDIAVTYKLLHIMVLFGRAASRYSPELIAESKKAIDLGILSTSLSYIGANFAENITTEFLAEMEHMSISHFRRLFKIKTGMTPTQYITLVRLNKAKELLVKTDMNIKQVAEAVGYDNQLYFTKLFTRQFGKSPKNFR